MSSVSIEAKAKKKKLVFLWILTVFIYSLILNSAAHVPEDIKHAECLMISKNIGDTPLHHFKLALARSYLTETQLLSYLAKTYLRGLQEQAVQFWHKEQNPCQPLLCWPRLLRSLHCLSVIWIAKQNRDVQSLSIKSISSTATRQLHLPSATLSLSPE